MNNTLSKKAEYILNKTVEALNIEYGESLQEASPRHLHMCLGNAAMALFKDSWQTCCDAQRKDRRAFYLSAEYLIGRSVYSNLYNMGILKEVKSVFDSKGVDLAELEEIEDAALGNGGLGRLAACFLDSAATEGLPLMGYGLRYRFGLFKQSFSDCDQIEEPYDWTSSGDPWSCRRDELAVSVDFADESLICVPYDMPIVGYITDTIGTLRLWQCEGSTTDVLYPDDSDEDGKKLRIRQEYILSSASLQDILRDYKAVHGNDLSELPKYAAIQLNDTHPAMAIPELIRLLCMEGMDFEEAFGIAAKTFSYTNHTVMSEAMEKWDMELLASVVPDICDIIAVIDGKLKRELLDSGLSIIRDGRVNMADLSVYVSKAVNGVAEIHSSLLKTTLFKEWYAAAPNKFLNITNGITPRRWLGLCNSELCDLIENKIGAGFVKDLSELERLKPLIDDETAIRFNAVKYKKKEQLCRYISQHEGIELSPDFIFDVQIKRLHEYKRQLLNALSITDIYLSLKDGSLTDFTPTAFIFGAKAAPGYKRAKAVIRYINRMAQLINSDKSVADKLKVVFVQNYNCSYAERIIPAADISEQISTAGTEASGTGNMKLMLNGAVTLGTLDGANIEILAEAGAENMYVFGSDVAELNSIRDSYEPRKLYKENKHLRRAIDTLIDGTVETDEGLQELYSALLDGASWHKADHYYVLKDFGSYQETRLRVNLDYRDRLGFGRKCLMNVASAGQFSSDRTIREYSENIWHLDTCIKKP